MSSPAAISVSGGSDGIEAHFDDLVMLAGGCGEFSHQIGSADLRLHARLAEPLMTGPVALLAPGAVARFEADLFEALDGPGGLTVLAAQCALLDLTLRAAAATYAEVERERTAAAELLQTTLRFPGAAARSVSDLQAARFARAADDLLTGDPGLVALIASALAPLDDPASLLYPDGHAVTTRVGSDPAADASGPPRGVADLLTGLARRDDERAPSTDGGMIDVRRLVGADGRVRYIVDIPGTKIWDVVPGEPPDVTGMASNLRAIDGRRTTYEDGVLAAMKAAGIGPNDPVLVVGHSLGGMVAVQTAIDCAHSGDFDVSTVVTAGSPIGRLSGRVPGTVAVLALENEGDVVPELDGVDNAPSPNVTTVTVHHDDGTITGNHSLEQAYIPGARDVDGSDNASVRGFVTGADGFLNATTVSTTTYAITRSP